MLDSLSPENIGGLYGRSGSLTKRLFLRRLGRKGWILLYSTVLFIVLLIWAARSHVLLGTGDAPWAFSLYAKAPSVPDKVHLAMLFDPVALLVLFITFATPFFCVQQVIAISAFNSMNEANIRHRRASLKIAELNALVRKVNKAFFIIGTRTMSIVILLLSFLGSYELNYFIRKNGVLQSWNPSRLPDAKWRSIVYDGWWANAESHIGFAVALVIFGTYLLYHVAKQLAMGLIFSIYARRALDKGFGVAPNLSVNIDGYYGLRKLRYFMQWTYVATLLDFFTMLGIIAVWLPFDQFTIFMILLIMATNVLTVLYPTTVAIGGSILEKTSYVKYLTGLNHNSRKERDELVEKSWTVANLPFRLRSTLTGVTLYFLVPVVLAIVAALLK